MNKGQEHILKGIVYEYWGDRLFLGDEGICNVNAIEWREDTDELEFYSGVKQIFPNETEIDLIYQYVVENF